tara:strand:- start:400 stop:1137 length:738 start_codon:yes stop_codon:yes gene_type:complete
VINIPDIGVRSIRIVQIPDVHSWTQIAPLSIPHAPPVTLEIGLPIINIPGCVEAHEQNNKSSTILKDDSNGIKVFCDAGLPSYNPIDYNPEQLIYTTVPGIPNTPTSPPTETPAVPSQLPSPGAGFKPPAPSNDEEECTENCEDLPKKVEEIKPEEKLELTDYLPDLPTTTTTAVIAVVATSSALLAKPLADLLLKLIKPTVKKAQKKLLDALGKKTKTESLRERVLAQRDRNRAILALRRALKK